MNSTKIHCGSVKFQRPRVLGKFILFMAFGAALLTTGLLSRPVLGGGGSENAVVVVNADSASSKLIANHYIYGRKIPARNVIYLNGIPDRETVSQGFFTDKILKPIIEEIQLRKLTVDYIIYSSDFPTMIPNVPHFRELEAELKKAGKTLDKRMYAPNASITSLTYFAGAMINDVPNYFMLDSNSYYRVPASTILRRPFSNGETKEEYEKATEVLNLETDDELDASIETLREILKRNPRQVAVAYWLTRRYAQKGDKKNAITGLTLAIRLGWQYRKFTQSDTAFDKLKDDPLFKGIVDRVPDEPFDFAPTRGFRQKYRWGANGFINQEPGQGSQFFLSSILAVTRNNGISEKDALRQLKRTMMADSTHPEGTFYFTETADVRSKTRQPNFGKAIAALERLGHKGEIVKTPMPVKMRDVLGVTSGVAMFNWTATGSKFVPGAFGDNLTSFGGRMHRPGQTQMTEFLKFGAAGGSGAVVEPYAIANKFPHPMIHVHYARGCSLAESFYQSVYGPFQILLVGDALCQPWAKKPKLTVTGMAPNDEVKGKVVLKLDVSESPVKVAGFELYVDGVVVHRTLMTESISFDTSRMTDGFHEVRIVAISDSPIESVQSTILPIVINNKGISTTLEAEHPDYLDTDTIKLTAKSNYGDSIELMHNGRSVAKRIGRDVEFEVEARILGRGPVVLEALAIAESGKTVGSVPVELEITGRLAERTVDTETNAGKSK